MPVKQKARCLWCDELKTREEFILSTWKNRHYTCKECFRKEPCRSEYLNHKKEKYKRTMSLLRGEPKKNICMKCGKEFKTYSDYRLCTDCKQTNAYKESSYFEPEY